VQDLIQISQKAYGLAVTEEEEDDDDDVVETCFLISPKLIQPILKKIPNLL